MLIEQNPLNPRSGESINPNEDRIVFSSSYNNEVIALLKSINEKLDMIMNGYFTIETITKRGQAFE